MSASVGVWIRVGEGEESAEFLLGDFLGGRVFRAFDELLLLAIDLGHPPACLETVPGFRCLRHVPGRIGDGIEETVPMIGILIVAHGAFGEALIHSASHVLGKRPLRVRQVGVTVHDDPAAILPQALDLVRQLDEGDGVLVLTDIYGATPGNIALKLLVPGRVEGVSGVNLPMLIRALTYRDQGLALVVEKALSGGTAGVIHMTSDLCNGSH